VNADTHLGGGASFPSTRPSFVAGMDSPAPEERARAAEVLVQSYWKPVYKYVRLRFRKQDGDAQDLTQGFLAEVLEKGWLARFDPRRGRFRSFLRLSLDGFVANEEKARGRAKRGGGQPALALDFAGAEGELAGLEPPAPDSVEAWFDAEWRRGVFASALAALEAELRARGQGVRAEVFRRYDLAEGAGTRPSYEELARALGLEVTDVTNHLHAARRAFRELLLARLRAETSDEAEFQRELEALLGGSWT
jgi:DNA-directed RNA polymerase specialized sigma24 family protein